MGVDYNELLKKYMQLILAEESVTYLSCAMDGWKHGAPKFTDEEMQVLKRIDDEIHKDY